LSFGRDNRSIWRMHMVERQPYLQNRSSPPALITFAP
jgi:hypothetical protein